MGNAHPITRRLFLKRAPVAAAIAAVPTVAVAHASSTASNALERAEYHATQLAAAMADPAFASVGTFEITIRSGDADQDVVFHNIGSFQLRRDYRLRQFMADASICDPSIVAWHHRYMPDHWTGLSFQLNAISEEAYRLAASGAPAMFGDDKTGTVFPVADFKRIREA